MVINTNNQTFHSRTETEISELKKKEGLAPIRCLPRCFCSRLAVSQIRLSFKALKLLLKNLFC